MLILKVGEVVDVDVILRMKDARKSMSACGVVDVVVEE